MLLTILSPGLQNQPPAWLGSGSRHAEAAHIFRGREVPCVGARAAEARLQLPSAVPSTTQACTDRPQCADKAQHRLRQPSACRIACLVCSELQRRGPHLLARQGCGGQAAAGQRHGQQDVAPVGARLFVRQRLPAHLQRHLCLPHLYIDRCECRLKVPCPPPASLRPLAATWSVGRGAGCRKVSVHARGCRALAALRAGPGLVRMHPARRGCKPQAGPGAETCPAAEPELCAADLADKKACCALLLRMSRSSNGGSGRQRQAAAAAAAVAQYRQCKGQPPAQLAWQAGRCTSCSSARAPGNRPHSTRNPRGSALSLRVLRRRSSCAQACSGTFTSQQAAQLLQSSSGLAGRQGMPCRRALAPEPVAPSGARQALQHSPWKPQQGGADLDSLLQQHRAALRCLGGEAVLHRRSAELLIGMDQLRVQVGLPPIQAQQLRAGRDSPGGSPG